jgi:hypothetical protein
VGVVGGGVGGAVMAFSAIRGNQDNADVKD